MVKGKSAQQPQQGAQIAQKGPKKPVYPTLQHADLYQRANFTLQASAFLQQLRPEPSSSDIKGKRKAISQVTEGGDVPDTSRLARSMMVANGRMVVHNQLKLDPSAKRNSCKGCSTVLIPGLTAKIRSRQANRHHMNVINTTCMSCSTQQTIPQPPTAISEEDIDGPKRARRRQRLSERRKVPFHQREAVPSSEDGVDSAKGHTLWRAGTTIHRWSEAIPETEADTGKTSVL